MTSPNPSTSLEQSSSSGPLPDELLIAIFARLDLFDRLPQLSICKKWNHLILSNFRFWQYLNIPKGTSFDLTMAILFIFSIRSQKRLEHFEIQDPITNHEDLIPILAQLTMSADTLKVLVLNQDPEFGTFSRATIQMSFPKVHTLFTLNDESNIIIDYLQVHRDRFGIGKVEVDDDETKVKRGLKCLYTIELGPFTDDQLSWYENLTYLKLDQTRTIEVLWEILSVTRELVELDLEGWESQEEEGFGLTMFNVQEKRRFRINSLETMVFPNSFRTLMAIAHVLDIDEEKTMVVGDASVLTPAVSKAMRDIAFKRFSLKILNRDFLPERMDEDLYFEYKHEPKSLFNKHTSIEDLVLICPLNPSIQVQEFFNKFFKDCAHKGRELIWKGKLLKSEDVEEEEGDSNQIQGFSLLPRLNRLTIRNPNRLTELDGKLLRNLIEKRREQNREFQLEFQNDLSQVIRIDDWEERALMENTSDR